MHSLPTPKTSAHVLVCVGPRCAGRGGRQLFTAMWEAMESERLSYYRTGGSVRLTASDCLGACDSGPTIACYQSLSAETKNTATWYGGVSFPEAMTLVRALHTGGPSAE